MRHALVVAVVWLAWLCLTLLLPGRVLAHGNEGTGTIQTFTQVIGTYEIAIAVETPPLVPASLHLTVMPPDTIGTAIIRLGAAPHGGSFDGAPVAEIQTYPGV